MAHRAVVFAAFGLAASAGCQAGHEAETLVRAVVGGPNFSPSARTVYPVAWQSRVGAVISPGNVLSGQITRIAGRNSYLVLDFGEEVGGIVTLHFAGASGPAQEFGLAFSESSLYVGPASDPSNGGSGADGSLVATISGAGSYTMPTDKLRGGFRYLTVFRDQNATPDGWFDLDGVSLAITFAPGVSNPAAYQNSFSSNDDLLNRIWYAGAYTVQTNTIGPTQGRVWPPPASGWSNDATIGAGSSILADGAKRDRMVWAGDLGISFPTQYVSTNDLVSTRNALNAIYQGQDRSEGDSAGELPMVGPPIPPLSDPHLDSFFHSDTYHTWTLLMTSTYYRYSGDVGWLNSVWGQFTSAMTYITDKMDGNGLLNVTRKSDWARSWQGGENIEANALLYAALQGGSELALVEGYPSLASDYASTAAQIKTAANALLWDPAVGLYRDNPDPANTLYPQDGNSLAVWYGLVDTVDKAQRISGNLSHRWIQLGAPTPEKVTDKPNTVAIATYPGSMEVHAHFAAHDDPNALALIRREWGYMLDSPDGTASTFWEGYRSDGSFDYDVPAPGYVSLSHGWSTGPTSALTFYVLGLSPSTAAGDYRFAPHPGDLKHAEGNITLPQGVLAALWSHDIPTDALTMHIVGPAGTTGTIGVPKLGGPSMSISLNGQSVWSNGMPVAGVNGVSQDAFGVYLSGLGAGTYDVTAVDVAKPAELPVGFTRCAGENGTCAVATKGVVAFGAGTYVYQVATSDTACTSMAFGGDPASGVLKSCYIAPVGVGPAGYTKCADENGTCAFTGTQLVAYGANGAFTNQLATNGVACNNTTFGADPIYGVVKACYLPPAGAPTGWTLCAAENSTCTLSGPQTVAYGAYGSFFYTTASGAVACSNDVFGDPLQNVGKACYTRVGAPAGFASQCASENATCSFSGQQTVAFGAAGRFIYKPFTGGTSCTTTSFGIDPIFDVAKACYLTP